MRKCFENLNLTIFSRKHVCLNSIEDHGVKLHFADRSDILDNVCNGQYYLYISAPRILERKCLIIALNLRSRSN